ncbi:MAG: hypothetical protein LIO96_00555 [Lachnospiraceae bacterium]|nr:hypothetical protein [Lachnospiraceae bacterium]
MSKYQFVNPYNFIPLSPGRAATPAEDKEKGYTGVIHYSVLTKTPLFIPNTSNSDTFDMQKETADHKSYDFLPTRIFPLSQVRREMRCRLSRAVKCAG